MKIRSKLLILTVAAIGLTAMTMPGALYAQGQLRYQSRYSKRDVGNIITRLETSSNVFKQDFNRALDNSRRNGTSAEDRYNQNVRDYASSLDRLRREFDRSNSWWSTRNEVSEVLSKAQDVNSMMNNLSFRRSLERQWDAMRNDLNTLADTYDMPGLNGGGWNGGPWNGNGGNGGNGGWNGNGRMSNPPSWSAGTFYGTAPDGSQIELTIGNTGQVTAMIGGSPSYGTYYRGNIAMGANTSRVVQFGNGIQTISNQDGSTISYYRNGYNNGGNRGNGGWSGNGRMSSPPSWAQGTFYGTAPDGSQIQLTLESNGQVTALIGGSPSYGTYYRGNITIGPDTSRVVQSGNGIQTVSNSDGSTIRYYRR